MNCISVAVFGLRAKRHRLQTRQLSVESFVSVRIFPVVPLHRGSLFKELIPTHAANRGWNVASILITGRRGLPPRCLRVTLNDGSTHPRQRIGMALGK